jgi:hypothetical protein
MRRCTLRPELETADFEKEGGTSMQGQRLLCGRDRIGHGLQGLTGTAGESKLQTMSRHGTSTSDGGD